MDLTAKLKVDFGGPGGEIFFSHFLLRIHARCLLVAKIDTMEAIATLYIQKCAQKRRFIDFQLLRTTEMLSLSIKFHFTLLSNSIGVKHSVKEVRRLYFQSTTNNVQCEGVG